MGHTVDLNCDMGESFGSYRLGQDDQIVEYVTSANIACGFHASDPVVMEKTVILCKQHGVMAGAHPGYPDLAGFGRRFMDCTEGEINSYVIYQVGALKGFLDNSGMVLQHVKLHGALYNYVARKGNLSIRIAGVVRKAFGDVIFLTPGTPRTLKLKRKWRQEGIRLALEAFPDRQYTDQGELLPRGHKDALITDGEAVARRAVQMVKRGGIESINGRWVELEVDTLCIHGDRRGSTEAARRIREHALKEGIEVKPLAVFV
jgi:5-oxoprolinase (ATP-hydrolysing) subunit A